MADELTAADVLADWRAALHVRQYLEPGPDILTKRELAKRLGLALKTVEKKLRRYEAEGRFEFAGWVRCEDGEQKAYRLVNRDGVE